jgi:hypothetical protein
VTFDCSDALVAANFWAAALNSDVEEDSTSAKAFVEAPGWGGPNLWFVQVPEPKTAKNRMHFDLRRVGWVWQSPGLTVSRGFWPLPQRPESFPAVATTAGIDAWVSVAGGSGGVGAGESEKVLGLAEGGADGFG